MQVQPYAYHWPLGLGRKSDIEMQIITFWLKTSELIAFGYELSDTQDGLRCWRNGIYILWLNPLLVTITQVRESGPNQDPYALLFICVPKQMDTDLEIVLACSASTIKSR